MGLFFLDQIEVAEARLLLERRRAVLREQLVGITAVPDHPGSLHFIIDHQKIHLEAELTWLETILNNLEIT